MRPASPSGAASEAGRAASLGLLDPQAGPPGPATSLAGGGCVTTMVPHLGPAMMLLRRAGVPAMLRRPAAAGACCRWASVAAVPAGGPGRQRQRRRGSAPGPGPGPASGAEPGPAPARAASAGEPGELVRINKRLSELGLCSRRESDGYIERGLVEVDGEIISLLGTKVTRQQRARTHAIPHRRCNLRP